MGVGFRDNIFVKIHRVIVFNRSLDAVNTFVANQQKGFNHIRVIIINKEKYRKNNRWI